MLNVARTQYQKWGKPVDGSSPFGRQENEFIRNELRSTLRNIDGDLEDLEETINILSIQHSLSFFVCVWLHFLLTHYRHKFVKTDTTKQFVFQLC